MPTIAAQCAQLAEQAVRERRTHLGFLEALLQAELEERDQRLIERRIREARLPRMKSLEEFDFMRNPRVSAQQIHELARGDYLAKAEPVIFIGDSGTGKTHLLTGLAVAACRQKRRVRFATAAGLINEMVEAKHQLQLGRALSRWARYDLIALDEVGYVPLAEVGADLQQSLHMSVDILFFRSAPGRREGVVLIIWEAARKVATVVRIFATRHGNLVAGVDLRNSAQS